MGNITERLDALYAPHLVKDEHFVPCGVVDEDAYGASRPRVMFLLKEVNDPGHDKTWTLPGFLRGQVEKGIEGQYRMWREVGTWVHGLRSGFPKFKDAQAGRVEGLRAIAVTNLKKSGGGGQADMEKVEEVAKRDRELWEEEIRIMDPDLIVCGNTYWIIEDILNFGPPPIPGTCGARHAIANVGGRDRVFLETYHPAARTKSAAMYAFFKEVVGELLESYSGILKGD